MVATGSGKRVVGLTGGIGSGKSTAAGLLGVKGALVIDVDLVCRDVIEPGGPAHAAVLDRFGSHLVTPEGRLDRAALAAVVFGDPAALSDLTALSHPAANRVMAERVIDAPAGSVVVLDMAVLAEYPRLGRWDAGPRRRARLRNGGGRGGAPRGAPRSAGPSAGHGAATTPWRGCGRRSATTNGAGWPITSSTTEATRPTWPPRSTPSGPACSTGG